MTGQEGFLYSQLLSGQEEEGVAFSNYQKWILLEEFEFLDTHIDYTIYIE